MGGITVLSLFDEIACGKVALERAGIEVKTYMASEIDQYAIKVAKKNHPSIKYLGNVESIVDAFTPIDLLIGGSPCQGFSVAGKQLNFSDPRSKLFFEYVRVLKEWKPKYFLLENVPMKKEFQDIISKELGVEPIMINSALVSAQSRKRLYWTNIQKVTTPIDRGILLKDIIEKGVTDRDKSFCIDANYYKGGNPKQYFSKSRRQLIFSQQYAERLKDITGKKVNQSKNGPKILLIPRGNNKGVIRAENGKVGTITSNSWEHNNFLTLDDGLTWRKLTPIECERLQTLPDGYTEGVSDSQRYKMLGNAWTVDVIAHILSHIKPKKRITAVRK